MPNQPVEHEEKNRPETKAERLEKRAENAIRADVKPEDREALKDRHLEAEVKEQKNRSMSPEEAATRAKRGEKVVGDATKALGFSLGIEKNNKKGDRDVLLPGRTSEEVKTLQKAEARGKQELPFDPDELQGKATVQNKPSFDEQLKQIQQDAIKQGAPPELFSENEKVRFVPAGTALEIRGQKYELNHLTAQCADVATDARDTSQSSPTTTNSMDHLRVRVVVGGDGVKRIDGHFLKEDNNLIDAVGKLTEPITNAVSKFTADSSKQLGDVIESGKRAVGLSPQLEEHKPIHQATGDGSTLPKSIQNPGDAANLGVGAGTGFVKAVNEMMPGLTPKGAVDGTVQAAKQLGELAKAHGAHEKNLHENPIGTLFNDAVEVKKMYDGAVDWANKRSQTESFAERGQDIGKASPDVLMASEIIFIANGKLMPPRDAAKLQLETKTPAELEALGIKRTTADQIKAEDAVNPIDRNALQQEKFRQLRQLSAENQPLIDDFKGLMDDKYASHSYGEPKLEETILKKVERPDTKARKPWFDIEHVRDGQRFTTVVDNLDVLPSIAKDLKASKFEVFEANISKMEPNERGWRMMPFDLRAPNGQFVEFQVLPREMHEAGKVTHPIYDKWRDKPLESLSRQEKIFRRDELMLARDVSEKAWSDYLKRTGQSELHVKALTKKVEEVLKEERK